LVCDGPSNGNFFLTMDSIRRIKKTNNFTAVNNDFIRDEKLSWKAKGIIIYLMSLPDDWKIYLSELANHAKDGRDSTNNGIKELIENGYCKRTEVRDSNGTFAGYNYEISDTKDFQPQTEKPQTENPHTENPFTDNPQLQNTNNNKEYNKPNTDNNLFDPPINIPPKKFNFKETLLSLGVAECYINDWLIVRKNKKASNTESALKRFITECNKANISVPEAVQMCAENSWQGFKAEYLNNNNNGIYNRQRQDSRRETPAPNRESISEDDWKF